VTVDTKEVVTTIAYLIGIRKDILELQFAECRALLEQLSADKEATVIRYLSKLRTVLMQKFRKIDTMMMYDLKNLNSIEWFDHDNIRQLEKWGFRIIQANYRSELYVSDFTRMINENIDKCSRLFYDWVNWNYIRDLFFIPKYQKASVLKKEFDKYMKSISQYPYQMYIHWNPSDKGNILLNDGKFLKVVYELHGDVFSDYSKYRDADESTRNSIYSFIDSSEKTAIAVDCENSDPFKLYSVLKGLNQDELSKIEKITLYDDTNTTAAWDWIANYTHIPVEHIEITRVTDRKSLVDVRMTASVVSDYYKNGISSFIIVSSDSDYWGLIETLPDADFLVMYEYEKCGTAIKIALEQHGIYYCSIDDFCSAGSEDMKRSVLFAELEKHLPNIYGEDPLELTHRIYQDTRISATMKEMEYFCSKYVKTLKLKIVDGKFIVEIQK